MRRQTRCALTTPPGPTVNRVDLQHARHLYNFQGVATELVQRLVQITKVPKGYDLVGRACHTHHAVTAPSSIRRAGTCKQSVLIVWIERNAVDLQRVSLNAVCWLSSLQHEVSVACTLYKAGCRTLRWSQIRSCLSSPTEPKKDSLK